MQKRNIIFLIIDSLSYKTLNSYPFPDELFLNNFVKKHSIVYDGVYTQGPYTEASMNGLAYGQRGLDGSAFMFGHAKFSHSFVDNIHNDYSTFCSGMSCRLFIDHSKKSFDKYHYHFYTPTTLPTLQWNRIEHFCNIYKTRQLSSNEKKCLIKLIDYSLNDSENFLNSLALNKYETSLSNNYIKESDINDLLIKIQKSKQDFQSDKETFLKSVLRKDIDFSKFDFNYYVPYEHVDACASLFDKYRPKLIKEAKKHYRFQFKKIRAFLANRSNLSFGKRNNFLAAFLKIISSGIRKRKNIAQIYSPLLKPDNNKKRAISFDRCLTEIKTFIANHRNTKPFFIYTQPDDYHQPSVFWSYDSSDLTKLEDELSSALQFSKRIKDKNCNIFDFLSIRYVDEKIKELFDFLKENNKLENTDVIITADHGAWSFNDYVRVDPDLIMTEERIHIPCMFFRYNQKESHSNKLHNSYSIPNSILKYEGYCSDNYFYGKAFNEDINNEYLLSENLGFGCPDIFNVPINYVVHNQKYKLNMKVGINEALTEKNCISFYNLTADPLEEINIIKKIKKNSKPLLEAMMDVAVKRHKEIQLKTTEEDFYSI